jgi:hypothetical protein
MASPARSRATILAHHLYDFAECEHRVALDVTLDRQRTPPDDAMAPFSNTDSVRAEVVEQAGYPAVEVENGDWEGASRAPALMHEGVAGIDWRVARRRAPGPFDLLERATESPSGTLLRSWDVKSARTTRSDAVFQVGFAALLLEAVQGRRPDAGFLILGDGRREEIDLGAIRCTVDDAVARTEEVANGEASTSPFFSPGSPWPRSRTSSPRRSQKGRSTQASWRSPVGSS